MGYRFVPTSSAIVVMRGNPAHGQITVHAFADLALGLIGVTKMEVDSAALILGNAFDREQADAGQGRPARVFAPQTTGDSFIQHSSLSHDARRQAAQELSVCGKWASQRWSAKPFSAIFGVDISDPLHPAAA